MLGDAAGGGLAVGGGMVVVAAVGGGMVVVAPVGGGMVVIAVGGGEAAGMNDTGRGGTSVSAGLGVNRLWRPFLLSTKRRERTRANGRLWAPTLPQHSKKGSLLCTPGPPHQGR